MPFGDLAFQQLRVRVRGERHHAEALALAPQHLQRGRADRSGRAEDSDAAGHTTPNSLKSPAVTGTTKYSESSRSSTPPRPGMSDEEALGPASRSNRDPATAPACAPGP